MLIPWNKGSIRPSTELVTLVAQWPWNTKPLVGFWWMEGCTVCIVLSLVTAMSRPGFVLVRRVHRGATSHGLVPTGLAPYPRDTSTGLPGASATGAAIEKLRNRSFQNNTSCGYQKYTIELSRCTLGWSSKSDITTKIFNQSWNKVQHNTNSRIIFTN